MKEVRTLSNLHVQQILRNRYFNIEFYKSHYDDTNGKNMHDIINHYITIGQKEGRIVSKKHASILTNNPEFDIEFYKSHHPDLHHMNPAQLVTHYINKGKPEGRIVNTEHLSILKNNIEFDIDFYKSRHPDLHNMNPAQLVNHYIEYGKQEGRICNKKFIFDTSRQQICIIYVYYERKNEQKNQTNLAFFIKYGLDKTRWRNMDITTLIMINGHQCELLIPTMENVHILYNSNEYDVITQKKGIQYFENLYNTPFYNSFTHLLIMNCGVIGPIYEEGLDRHWLDQFLNKLTNNTVICSPCINFLKKKDVGGPGPRCQSYCSLIKINEYIYNLLLNTKISNLAPGTINNSVQIEYDYVFGYKNDQINTILIGEYGITRILLDNGYNISCLIYDDIDYKDKTIWNTYSDRIDRMPNMPIQNFNKQVFIKNYWRETSAHRDSLPCFYNESIMYIYNKLNYKNICSDLPSVKYNYDLININRSGTLRHNTSMNWNNNQQFYDLFGYAEEHIIWPKQKLNNAACVIYRHYHKDNIIKDYVIQALKTLIFLEYDIFFCTTSSKITNVDLPFDINYFENNDLSDLYIWHNIMNKQELTKYSRILLMNDSIMLPIHGIENMKNTILNMRQKSDFWGLYEYNEQTIHLCRCFIEFNRNSFTELIKLYNQHIISLKTTLDETNKIELLQTQHLVNHGFSYDAVVSYNYSTQPNYNIMLNPENMNILLINKDCFGINCNYLRSNIKYDNPYLNYLMRLL